MKRTIGFVFCFCFHLLSATIEAAPAADFFLVKESKEENYILLSDYFDVLEDSSRLLSLQTILSDTYQQKFVAVSLDKKFPIIERTGSAYWLRFKVKFDPTLPDKRWILENLDPHIDEFELYSVSPQGEIKINKTGYQRPFLSREYVYKNFAYDIPADTTAHVYYIRVVSALHNPIILKIKSSGYFLFYALNEYYLLGLFYGILLIMAVYNLMLFLSMRDSIHLYYFFYVLAAMIVTLSEDATGFQFIWQTIPSINRIIYLVSPLLITVTFALYSRVFLELKKNLPLWDKIIRGVLFLYLIYFPVDLFIIRSQIGIPGYFIPFALIYAVAWISYLKGNKSARFYIVGYTFTFFSILLLILRMGGITFWSDLFTLYSFNIGLVFEIVIFSFAIGDRLKIIKEQKEDAEVRVVETQAKLIEQLRENEKLKDKVNNELEEKVKERTVELEEQSEKITVLNELLKKHNIKLQDEVKTISHSRVMNKAVSFEDFKKIYPDDESCLKFIGELKWPQNEYKCRKCNNTKFCQGRDTFSKRCTKCSYDESPTVNTIFHKLKFPIIKAFYILFLTSSRRNITADELSGLLDLRRQTCLDFKRKVEGALTDKKAPKNAENGWSYAILNE